MQSPNKTDISMSIDSAVWYIEAALNYTFCIVSKEEAQSKPDESEYCTKEIAKSANNNLVTLAEATELFNTFSVALSEKIVANNAPIKFYTMADIDYKDGNFTLNAELLFKSNATKTLWNITGDWEWGMGLGMCDGTHQGEDLKTQILKWIRNNNLPQAGAYYTDLSREGLFGSHPYPSQAGQNSTYHDITNYATPQLDLFFWEIFGHDAVYSFVNTGWHHCVPEADCNYYAKETQRALTVLDKSYIFEIGGSRNIVSFDIIDWHYIDNFYARASIGHTLDITSGIPHHFYGNI